MRPVVAKQQTELKLWLVANNKDTDFLVGELAKLGRDASPAYLDQVANGFYEPGWPLCVLLEKITGVNARVIKDFPYRLRGRKAEKAA